MDAKSLVEVDPVKAEAGDMGVLERESASGYAITKAILSIRIT